LGAHHVAEVKFFLGQQDRRGGMMNFLDKSAYNNGRDDLSDFILMCTKNLLENGNPNSIQHKDITWHAWNNDNPTKGLILDAGKQKAAIGNLTYELFPDSIKNELDHKINKDQSEVVNFFMFIFK
jgi:hypothetical protein